MHTNRYLSAAAFALVLVLAGCSEPVNVADAASATVRSYGPAQAVGNGLVRAYVTTDKRNPNRPVEIGVAMSEAVMEGLPKSTGHEGHDMAMNSWDLALPQVNPTPYKFVSFGWNPAGHEPPGIYDLPHFDFHFWRASVELKNSIVQSDSQWNAKAARYPAEDQRAPFHLDVATAAKAPAGAVAVPMMGMHWLDVRSPELQGMAGKPENFKPFTKTYIYGSWDGEFVFDEPMITRAYILSKKTATAAAVRDEIVPISTQPKYALSGFYPSAYRITYDAQAKEYRVALTQLAQR